MLTVNMVVEQLKDRGFDAEYREVVKNGVYFDAICIREEGSNMAPTIYMNEILEDAESKGATLDEVTSKVIAIHTQFRKPYFDADCMNDKEFILSHVTIALQKDSTEDLIKRPSGFEGIESYLYVSVEIDGEWGAVKLNKKILELSGVTEDEVWKSAEENLQGQTKIVSMGGFLANMMGVEEDPLTEEYLNGLYIISNKSGNLGASAILDKKAIKELSEECGFTEYYAIPSSRHEMLIIPCSNVCMDMDYLTHMVREVNATTVNEVDQLTDRAYKMAV